MEFSIKQIKEASTNVRKFIEENKRLPLYVTIANTKVKMQDYLYLAVSATLKLATDPTAAIQYKNLAAATNPRDEIHSGNIPRNEYLVIANQIKKLADKENRAPDFAYQTSIGNFLGFPNLVYMYAMILDYFNTSGRIADFAEMKSWGMITGKAPTPSYTPPILIAAYKAVNGRFNTVTGAIERLKTEIYCNYNSDVFPQGQAMTRLLNGQCLNCADFAQLLKAWIEALNLLGKRYQWRYAHIRCQSGAGHIILQVKGEELGDEWVDVDPAAAANNDNYKIGTRWCQTGKIESFNDPWLMVDDGEF